jgi:rhodanese-related sulfurtransferase
MNVATVGLTGLQGLLDRGAQLVEVLPRAEYEELHLPGAVSVPLKELDVRRADDLDRTRPVVLYCWDALCDMSPRAAVLLSALGFEAFDYALGKVDWMAHGLPMEGAASSQPTAASFARQDVAVCTLDEAAARAAELIGASPYPFALVLGERVVLGRVRRSALQHVADDQRVKDLMEPGPSTIRPDAAPSDVAAQLDRADAQTAILTTPEGRLLGVVRREDLSRA